jgi:DNA helicase MCM8
LNFDNFVSLRKLKANNIGKFISIKGTVIKVGSIKPIVTDMVFKCTKCDLTQRIFFQDGKYSAPLSCVTLSCKSRTFNPDLKGAETTDFQRIKVQEQVNENVNEGISIKLIISGKNSKVCRSRTTKIFG